MLCVLDLEMFHLNKIVIPRIAAYWEDVAYALGYDIPIVEYIKHNHHDDLRECCKELLNNWLTTNNGVKPKSWSTLLQKVGEVINLARARQEIIEDLEAAETPQSTFLSAVEIPQSSTGLSVSPIMFSLSKWLSIIYTYIVLNFANFRARNVSFNEDCSPQSCH